MKIQSVEKFEYSEIDTYEKEKRLDEFGEEISAEQFYSELFNDGVDLQGVFDRDDRRGNVIAISKDLQTGKTKRYTVHADEGFKDLRDLPKEEFIFLSPISYFGKKREMKNARFMYALAFDLDGVSSRKMGNLLHQITCDVLPFPTYIVDSGGGVHLYYKFETPVPMFPAMREVLQELKTKLTDLIWNLHTSELKKKQFQSINQGFRVVGTFTKSFLLSKEERQLNFFMGDSADTLVSVKRIVSAYKCGRPVTLDYLQSFLHNMDVDFEKVGVYNPKCSLAEAKVKFPEWYQRRIVDGLPAGQWVVKRDLYDWWKKQIMTGASGGHRYWCIYTLTAYAVKCDIPYDELEKDAYSFLEYLDSIDEQPFTRSDVRDALKLYRDKTLAVHLTRGYLSQQTAILMPKNKRNGRKQEQHLKIARFARDLNYKNEGGWREGNGRKPKEDIVRQWRENNPRGRKMDCHRETGLSRVTIDKWWK